MKGMTKKRSWATDRPEGKRIRKPIQADRLAAANLDVGEKAVSRIGRLSQHFIMATSTRPRVRVEWI
jgi:hypothetical protein